MRLAQVLRKWNAKVRSNGHWQQKNCRLYKEYLHKTSHFIRNVSPSEPKVRVGRVEDKIGVTSICLNLCMYS